MPLLERYFAAVLFGQLDLAINVMTFEHRFNNVDNIEKDPATEIKSRRRSTSRSTPMRPTDRG